VESQRILIVSSNDAQSRFMMDCLAQAGYTTSVAGQDENVVSEILDKTPSLVILDWGSLDSSGIQYIQKIRSNENKAHVPILVMGVEMAEEDVLAALEAGADICLTEKLHPRVFVARVHSLLRRNI
jgi:DNA-binding response OmpR family regulator